MKALKTLYAKILNNKLTSATIVPVYRKLKAALRAPGAKETKERLRHEIAALDGKKKIFYLGAPAHPNLGDLAQGVCIRRWLKKHFPDYAVVEIRTDAIVNTRHSVIGLLKESYRCADLIVFQSGYATTDLGGYADDMHCAVIRALPDAKMLMMPQTVFFESEERKKRTSTVYNSASRLLFLARDRVSFETAKGMFPDTKVLEYPDIVTTLIGTKHFPEKREGILFCCRDDGEKYYSDEEIEKLMERCSGIGPVTRTDTTKYRFEKDIVQNPEKYIFEEIEKYSKYKVMITDRYHGTIFSLIAGTPVVIIKTTDHKVTTGADWFHGVYDDYVYPADSLESAYEIAERIYRKQLTNEPEPYFEKEYYDKLPAVFMNV